METEQPAAVKQMGIIVKTNRNSMWSNFLYSLKGCSLSARESYRNLSSSNGPTMYLQTHFAYQKTKQVLRTVYK